MFMFLSRSLFISYLMRHHLLIMRRTLPDPTLLQFIDYHPSISHAIIPQLLTLPYIHIWSFHNYLMLLLTLCVLTYTYIIILTFVRFRTSRIRDVHVQLQCECNTSSTRRRSSARAHAIDVQGLMNNTVTNRNDCMIA